MSAASHAAKLIDLDSPDNYLNREMSWLSFNARVLAEGLAETTPLLEQLKFLTIFSSNLDELFMVRVAGLRKLIQEDIPLSDSPDNTPTREVLREIHTKTQELVGKQYRHLQDKVLPSLAENGVKIARYQDLSEAQKNKLGSFFDEQVFPVLTPLAIDATHPFPFMSNLSLYLVVVLGDSDASSDSVPLMGLVEIPSVLPRLVSVEQTEQGHIFVLLEDLVAAHLSSLFLGFSIRASYPIRATRNLDYTLLESEVVDLLKTIQKEEKDSDD